MRVSVVVATRNRPLELRRALSAITSQSYPDIEIVVVDDGSSGENARKNEILVDSLTENAIYTNLSSGGSNGSGPSRARNEGVERTSGDLIAFCDDDDYWCDNEHIENMVSAFSSDVSLDLMFANQAAHADGEMVRAVWLPQLVKKLHTRATSSRSGVLISKGEALTESHAHINTCVFRKALLVKIGGFWESVRYQEDMDLFVRAVDGARHIKYRHQTVSIHNIPDRTRADNASTQLDHNEKAFAETQVAHHLTRCCRSAEARHYANELAGFAYRHLALAASRVKDDHTAFTLAKVAWSWRPTIKWTAYTVFLGFKALLSRGGPHV